jgi:GntR family transcriptional regulator
MLNKLDKNSYIPYYVQIKHILLDRIQTGSYREGQLIPSEADLASQFSVTRTTVRKALDELKREGTIKTERGKGSVVSADSKIEQSLQQFYRFGVEVGDTGVPAVSRVITAEKCIPPQDIIDLFSPNQGNTFYRIVRLRFFKDEPVSLESSYIPCSIAPDIISYDIRTDSLAGLLEKVYGHKISKATEFLYPRISDEYQSELLEIENHSPVFQTERQTKNTDDVIIEYRISIIRGDKVKFSTELY